MSSLVADYGSSDDSDKDENDSILGEPIRNSVSIEKLTNVSDNKDEGLQQGDVHNDNKRKKKLLNPLLKKKAGNALLKEGSVFYNPFLKEIDSKKLVLEKHVKMTDNPKDVREINGKKICWNHRKGKCRFGHNCKYAHQSDLAMGTDAQLHTEDTHSNGNQHLLSYVDDSAVITSEDNNPRKRKPGLSDSLMPNKKALKMYKKQQQAQQPWLRTGGT